MAQMLQNPVFALLGCQRMSVNTLLCDILGLAEKRKKKKKKLGSRLSGGATEATPTSVTPHPHTPLTQTRF